MKNPNLIASSTITLHTVQCDLPQTIMLFKGWVCGVFVESALSWPAEGSQQRRLERKLTRTLRPGAPRGGRGK